MVILFYGYIANRVGRAIIQTLFSTGVN